MADPYVRTLGSVEDIDGHALPVGVDYDSVSIGHPGSSASWRLNREQCEEFARAFVAACWEAADNARLMAEEASGGV